MSSKKFTRFNCVGDALVYVDDKFNTFCAICANDEYIDSGIEFEEHSYFEGPPYCCDSCSCEIKSTYGFAEDN